MNCISYRQCILIKLFGGILFPVCFVEFYLNVLLNEEEVEKGSSIFLLLLPKPTVFKKKKHKPFSLEICFDS